MYHADMYVVGANDGSAALAAWAECSLLIMHGDAAAAKSSSARSQSVTVVSEARDEPLCAGGRATIPAPQKKPQLVMEEQQRPPSPSRTAIRSKTNSFELFRVREQLVPVEMLEIKELVQAFAWEPQGHRFAVVHGGNEGAPILRCHLLAPPPARARGFAGGTMQHIMGPISRDNPSSIPAHGIRVLCYFCQITYGYAVTRTLVSGMDSVPRWTFRPTLSVRRRAWRPR